MRTRPLRLWRSAEPTLWPDIALAAVLGVAAVWLTIHSADPTTSGPGPDAPAAPWGGVVNVHVERDWHEVARSAWLNLVIAAALVGRRRWPLVCFALQFSVLLGFDPEGNVVALAALLIGVYSLAVHGRSALASIGVLLGTGALTAAIKDDTWPRLPGWVGVFALMVPVGLTGVAFRAARGRARAWQERAEAVRREQQAATQLAVARERARIARELHDVVSHHVSVMTIQAGAAGKVLDTDPELARGALSAIEASGRETMSELRHLLGVLTLKAPAGADCAPGPTDDLLRPQPGLDQLDALVDNVRRAGQPVSVRRTPAQLPRGMDLTAYRVVQEALTNALRYAPGARTEIDIGTEPPADLVIEVTNDAPRPGGPHAEGAGSGAGLLGLAERLRLYGGTLETGRRVGGGFRLRARLPLEATR